MKANPRIGIVGLGTIGSQELALWQRAGHSTVGFDVAKDRIKALQGAATSGSRVTSTFGDLADCDILILCLPNLGPSGELSLAAFDHFVEGMNGLEPADRLIVIASTIPIGFTRELALRIGAQGGLIAHVPERFDPGRSTELGEIPRVVGGLTAEARDLAAELYTHLGIPITKVDPVEVAEASKLLENSFRLVNIAFINEFAELCRRVGITAADVIDAAATKPFAFMAHSPGVGAGGTCIPTMPQYLLQAAAEAGLQMPILAGAVAGNSQVGDRVAEHLRGLLQTRATYKPNYPDARLSAALRFARGLAAHHDVVVFDPIVDESRFPTELELVRDVPSEKSFDAVVIAVKHKGTDLAALRLLSPILIDLVRGSVEVTESIPTRP